MKGDFRKINEACGVFGVFAKEPIDVVQKTHYALFALQHRGQQSCGVAVNRNGTILLHKNAGTVPEVFNESVISKLQGGNIAIGHVKSNQDSFASRDDAQPLLSSYLVGSIAMAGNTCITNVAPLRDELIQEGAIFQSDSDIEVIAYVFAKERTKHDSIEQAICSAMKKLEGAYSLVVMSKDKLIAVRDPLGIRPLCIGRSGDSVFFASESCALDASGAELVRDVLPGEIIKVTASGMESLVTQSPPRCHLCSFEFVYFLRPDSIVEGTGVHLARREAGAILAREHPAKADIVIGVPDSGLAAAVGYSKESGIPYEAGFIKNKYINRSLASEKKYDREESIHLKLNVLRVTIKGRDVVLVDDSIVRGDTMTRLVSLLRSAGATAVHVRIASPPIRYHCPYGTNFAGEGELAAAVMSKEQIRKMIGADSLEYLHADRIAHIHNHPDTDFCVGCFTGQYPNQSESNCEE